MIYNLNGFEHITAPSGAEYVVCRALAAVPGLAHCFTTRRGGVSGGECASLNMAWAKGDPARTAENYARVCRALGIPQEICFTRQVHGSLVRRADRPNAYDGAELCDGVWTDKRGLPLAAASADCVPILLYGGGKIAAVHAGWRGTAARIAQRAVEAMGVPPRELIAAIGPAIGKCCFLVHEDVMESFRGFPAERAEDGRYALDLPAINAGLLADAGVGDIHVCPECTCCSPDTYFSHRRDGAARGGMAAIIALK